MRGQLPSAVCAAIIFASTPALADPTVDGAVSAGEYGSPTATVATDSAAPTSNFGAPGNSATAGYDIRLASANDTLFGAITQTGGTTAGSFANLYFDIDPVTGSGGSELGIEVTNGRGFVAGTSNYFDISSAINYSVVTLAGLTTTEFSIANSVFRDFIAGAASAGYFSGGYTPQNVRLNLSQSLSYSVAGGASYGSERLGSFSVAAPTSAVPEPTTWAMMLLGFGVVGSAMRRRKVRVKAAFA
ncbi:PEPxxWA-CTERM sorting domain-containing protein [Sphingomonas sp. M1-B02]|uniref:PEPxxWA-CTERM sorting domain-containing protein n=1 Tax=Sphingomonas sp. M1-B02 TaxID=3114300 RepID=UPI0022402A83|nr:PEPxxWA-CTERM sorting domain-containing protein [Sphingomonas sp. S6-11]UZK67721.1 PEPxxWA-CTERM sorting domain-containing protein [Sphingomonas sp. S6-11]